MNRLALVPIAATALVTLGACGGTPSAATTTAATTESTVATPTTPAGHVRNVPLTPRVIHQLVVAAAVVKRVPASGFSGLEPAQRYYAYDHVTRTWWAAGALQATNPDAGGAAVSLNDAGAYDVFHRTVGGRWVVRESGGAGGPDQPLSRCTDWPPLSVLRLWHWSLKVCRPPY